MNLKGPLFALIFFTSFIYSSIAGFNFFQKEPPPIIKNYPYSVKLDVNKIVFGSILFCSGIAATDSIPLHMVKASYTITGALIGSSGIAQLVWRLAQDEHEGGSLYPNSYEQSISYLLYDNRIFLAGAALTLSGAFLRLMESETSDMALACTISGMTLTGLEISKHVAHHYGPHILALIKKYT